MRCLCCNSSNNVKIDHKTDRWYCHSCWTTISEIISAYDGYVIATGEYIDLESIETITVPDLPGEWRGLEW